MQESEGKIRLAKHFFPTLHLVRVRLLQTAARVSIEVVQLSEPAVEQRELDFRRRLPPVLTHRKGRMQMGANFPQIWAEPHRAHGQEPF